MSHEYSGTHTGGPHHGTLSSSERFRLWFSHVNRPAIMRIRAHPVIRTLTDILYVLLFVAVSCLSFELLQWGVNPGTSFLHDFVFSNFLIHRVLLWRTHTLFMNILLIMLAFAGLVLLINRFWVAATLLLSVSAVFGVADRIKMEARNEPILLSDLKLASGNTGEIASFIPSDAHQLIAVTIIVIVLLVLCAVLCAWYFGPGRVLHVRNNAVRIVAQIVLSCIPFVPFSLFAANVGNVESAAHQIATSFGDYAIMWDSKYDSRANGTLLSLMRQIYVKVIDKPSDYGKTAMAKIAKEYGKEARQINVTRKTDLTRQNVVLILSESYSDPTRVPGVAISGGDPMPFIRSLKNRTTSGFMLSSGYGGGTANLEFQALTGFSTANFNASLKSPYQQFVPSWNRPVSFNQLWNGTGHSTSVAFHASDGSLYLRHTNYRKFDFHHFWTLDGPEHVRHTGKIAKNPYVSDAASYQNVTDYLASHAGTSSFIQMATMQNHMPYLPSYYPGNTFSAKASGASNDELLQIAAYSRGMKYTDNATKQFLATLEKSRQPVTVIWYGDHLPGIYPAEIGNPNNSLTMHETDYFIWSNSASGAHGRKVADAAYSSPNYFVAQAAQQMNAKVSPYLAFLTRMHEAIPAMEPELDSMQGTNWHTALTGAATYVDANGERIRHLTAYQKRMIHEYQLITYDLTLGNGYLGNAFTRLSK